MMLRFVVELTGQDYSPIHLMQSKNEKTFRKNDSRRLTIYPSGHLYILVS